MSGATNASLEKNELDTLRFVNDRNRIRVQFEPHTKGLRVVIDGRGVKWPSAMPSDKPTVLPYRNWLELKGRRFSLDHLDEFETEMLELIEGDVTVSER